MPGKRRIAIDPAYEEDSKESEQTKHITKITKTTTIVEHINGTVKEKMIIEKSDITRQVKSGESMSLVENKGSVDKKTMMPAKNLKDISDVKREAGRPKGVQKDEKTGKDKSPNAKSSTSKQRDGQKPKSPNEKGKKFTSKETEHLKADKTNQGLISDIARKESIRKGKDNTKDNIKEKSKGYGKYQKMNRNRAELVSKLDNYKPVDQVIELGDGKISNDTILISSWNVAGLCNILKGQHLHNYVKDRQPDILCLNETKLTEDFIKGVGSKWIPEGYSGYFNCCKIRSWYSGTALITKHKPISVTFDIGIKKHALEGRTITVEFEHFYLVASYVPNAGDGLVGLKYRVEEWDPDFKNYVSELKKKKHVVICGDLNCAYQDIDIHNPKGKEKFAGFSPEERKSFGELLNTGFVDTFRHLHPSEKKFSFFSQKLNNRPKNMGWRLDYFLVDKEGISGIKESLINDKIYGSDHLPIELTLKPNFN